VNRLPCDFAISQYSHDNNDINQLLLNNFKIFYHFLDTKEILTKIYQGSVNTRKEILNHLLLTSKHLMDDREEILCRRGKEHIGSLTHLPWRAVPGKPATPFRKNTRRGETGASRLTME